MTLTTDAGRRWSKRLWSKIEPHAARFGSGIHHEKRAREGALFMLEVWHLQSLLPNKRKRNKNKLRKSR